jgi:hypothetical protein
MKTFEVKEGKYYLDDKKNVWRAGANGTLSVYRRVDPAFAYPCRILIDGYVVQGSPSYTLVEEYIKNPWSKDSDYYSNFEFVQGLEEGDILRDITNDTVFIVHKKVLIALAFLVVDVIGKDSTSRMVLHCTDSNIKNLRVLSKFKHPITKTSDQSNGFPDITDLLFEYLRILEANPKIEKYHKYIAVDYSGGFNTFMQEPTYDEANKRWDTEDGMHRHIHCNSSFRLLSYVSCCYIPSIRENCEHIMWVKKHTESRN